MDTKSDRIKAVLVEMSLLKIRLMEAFEDGDVEGMVSIERRFKTLVEEFEDLRLNPQEKGHKKAS